MMFFPAWPVNTGIRLVRGPGLAIGPTEVREVQFIVGFNDIGELIEVLSQFYVQHTDTVIDVNSSDDEFEFQLSGWRTMSDDEIIEYHCALEKYTAQREANAREADKKALQQILGRNPEILGEFLNAKLTW